MVGNGGRVPVDLLRGGGSTSACFVCVEVCGGGKGQVIRDRCGMFGGGGQLAGIGTPAASPGPLHRSTTLKTTPTNRMYWETVNDFKEKEILTI